MNLENTKNNFLRIFLALIFLSAGFYRLFFPSAGYLEMQALSLPSWFSWPVCFLELVSGFMLLLNFKIKLVLWFLIFFLALALIQALVVGGGLLFLQAGELFVFNPTPTDIFLHLIFLFFVIYILYVRRHD